ICESLIRRARFISIRLLTARSEGRTGTHALDTPRDAHGSAGIVARVHRRRRYLESAPGGGTPRGPRGARLDASRPHHPRPGTRAQIPAGRPLPSPANERGQDARGIARSVRDVAHAEPPRTRCNAPHAGPTRVG